MVDVYSVMVKCTIIELEGGYFYQGVGKPEPGSMVHGMEVAKMPCFGDGY